MQWRISYHCVVSPQRTTLKKVKGRKPAIPHSARRESPCHVSITNGCPRVSRTHQVHTFASIQPRSPAFHEQSDQATEQELASGLRAPPSRGQTENKQGHGLE